MSDLIIYSKHTAILSRTTDENIKIVQSRIKQMVITLKRGDEARKKGPGAENKRSDKAKSQTKNKRRSRPHAKTLGLSSLAYHIYSKWELE